MVFVINYDGHPSLREGFEGVDQDYEKSTEVLTTPGSLKGENFGIVRKEDHMQLMVPGGIAVVDHIGAPRILRWREGFEGVDPGFFLKGTESGSGYEALKRYTIFDVFL